MSNKRNQKSATSSVLCTKEQMENAAAEMVFENQIDQAVEGDIERAFVKENKTEDGKTKSVTLWLTISSVVVPLNVRRARRLGLMQETKDGSGFELSAKRVMIEPAAKAGSAPTWTVLA